MPYLPLLVVALAVALIAFARASGHGRAVEDAAQEARRKAENAAEELRRELATLKQMVATLAGGGRLTREMVLDGQLWRDVGPDEGKALVERGEVKLLDVRTPQETAGGIIPGAQIIPVDQLEARVREVPKEGLLLIYCAGGGRSAAACEFLANQGFQGELMNLEGGFGAWQGPRAKP